MDLDAPGVVWKLDLVNAGPVVVHAWPGADLLVRPAELMPDPVVRQRNGRPAYQVASLADDLSFGITFIVRGADLLPSTVCQLHLARVLGEEAFLQARFVHHRLLTDEAGAKLSKSQGAGPLQELRLAGADPGYVHRLAADLLEDLQRGTDDQA